MLPISLRARLCALLLNLSLLATTSCKVMVSLGDSITRAANVTAGCSLPFDANGGLLQFLPECAQFSWSVGFDLKESQYQRLAATSESGVSTYNQAITGATSNGYLFGMYSAQNSLAGQYAKFQSQYPTLSPDYLTIASGANDLCQQNASTVASSNQIYNSVLAAIKRAEAHSLAAGRSTPIQIVVAPVPPLVKLKSVMLGTPSRSAACWKMWNQTHRYCPQYLVAGAPTTNAKMTEAIKGINAKLASLNGYYNAQVHVTYAQALENYDLTAGDVSTVDCFHPSIQGQRKISELAWSSGWATR